MPCKSIPSNHIPLEPHHSIPEWVVQLISRYSFTGELGIWELQPAEHPLTIITSTDLARGSWVFPSLASRDCSNFCRCSFISPRLVNPTNAPVCLLNTGDSLICISSIMSRTFFSYSGQEAMLAASINWMSTAFEKPAEAGT